MAIRRCWRTFCLLAVTLFSHNVYAASCDFSIDHEWNAGFRAFITINNDTAQPIEGWTVSLDFTDGTWVTGMWHARANNSNPYQATNEQYNGTIAVGSSVTFGFNTQKGVNDTPAVPPILGGVCESLGSNQAPVAQAVASVVAGTAPLAISFDGSASSDPDDDPLTYQWDFGDGNSATGVNANHSYGQPGSYTVTLTVSDTDQESASTTLAILVSQAGEPQSYLLDATGSSLHFVSTKKIHTLETHTFTAISGEISADGNAVVRLDLSSVETAVEIRNQRMRDYVFETANFPEAEISLAVNTAQLNAIAVGDSLALTITPQVDLHGVILPLAIPVSITRLSDRRLLVQNTSPILVNAADFSLVDGIEILRDLASLSVISYTVPTNFTLIFDQQ